MMNNQIQFKLTDKQVKLFWEEGFLSLENIAPLSEVKILEENYNAITELIYPQQKISEIVERKDLPLDEGQSLFLWLPLPGILTAQVEDRDELDEAINIVKHCLTIHTKLISKEEYENRAIKLIKNLLEIKRNIKKTIYFQNVINIAAQILNVRETQILAEGRFFFKPAQYGSTVHWHQDGAHPTCSSIIKIWMTLDPVDEQNGCMEFIKYSHQRLLKCQPYEGDPSGSFMKTDDDEIDFSHRVACPLPAGGATIHHRLTVHYTGANRTNRPRRVLTIVCRVADSAKNI
jgi:ectoine hydroxylase-related dioxygenase (phytanoyl-CoA dioxygenase family)